ncbi:MAG: glycosyltransferase family 4 protein [Spirochaetales bacterium]|nr:glycosyltransferase family 4 protein [Spirochaetales bacterium]
MTSVHPRYDTRIFLKECCSLAAADYQVSLIVADGKGDESIDGVNIYDVGSSRGRLNRVFKTTRMMLEKAKALDADIYHLHDPELIPLGLKLKKSGKAVVFDAHEDVPKQLMNKPYLGRLSSLALSHTFASFERFSCARLDGILTATPFIRDKFLAINRNSLDVNNFPLIGELDSALSWEEKHNEVCYVGGISVIRGIREIVCACSSLKFKTRLNLAGNFIESDAEVEVKASPGWLHVNELGFLNRSGIRNVLARSIAGLVTLHPTINYLDSLPVKMFEYMAAGIPVIASNFPLWREIVEGNDCGICVDPLDPKAIAEAIDYLVQNPEIAQRMGENGRQAVLDRYNWAIEEQKLLRFYSQIIDG